MSSRFWLAKEAIQLGYNGAELGGRVFLTGNFRAIGKVDLVGGEGLALDANGVEIENSVLLRKVVAVGEFDFSYAQIRQDFQWRDVKSAERAALNLQFARVGRLFNDPKSRPNPGNLTVAGLVFDQIDERAGLDSKTQLAGLDLVPLNKFSPQPFEQLAKTLRDMGREEDRRKVLIKKNEILAKRHSWISSPEWLWYGVFGKLIGYGYRPWNAFYISLVVIGIGWLLFRLGFDWNLMTPTDEKAIAVPSNTALQVPKEETSKVKDTYPKFNAFVYSMETFVPLLKLV